MINEIDIQKLKEEHPDFFEQIFPELLEFITSDKTSSQIAEICFKNEITDEEIIEKIAYRITLVLLNRLPKENLFIALEKGIPLDLETAQNIASDVNLSIFSQIQTISHNHDKAESENKKEQHDKPSLYTYIFPEEETKEPIKEDIHQKQIK